MNTKKLFLSLITAGVLAALSSATPAYALSNYTLNGNYVITGDLYVDSLLGHLGECLEVGTGPLGASEIVATGAPCGGGGGGGVTSVTAGPSGNITAAPNTGAVIVDEIEDPTFTGEVTAETFYSTSGNAPHPMFSWQSATLQTVQVQSDNSNSVSSIHGGAMAIKDGVLGTALALDESGNLGIAGTYYSGTLGSSVGDCLEVGANGSIISTGAACASGGGAVTSVTSSNANLTAAPTTGAVVLGFSASPTFAGNTTVGSLTSAGAANVGSVNASGAISGATLLGTGLTSGDCVQASTGGLLTTTGAACASGGVTSITPGSSGNLTFTPSTGAVVGDIIEHPTFTGLTTTEDLLVDPAAEGTGSVNFGVRLGANTSRGQSIWLACPTGEGALCTTAGVYGTIFNLLGSITAVSIDDSGDIGAAGYLAAGNLASSVGDCLEATTNGEIISTGSACGPSGGFPTPQTLHGNQSITAVAAACTPGTPIVFAHTFSAIPDIIMSTSAVVGDTAAPETGTITTTGFTPELCSVASASAATVYWQAVN